MDKMNNIDEYFIYLEKLQQKALSDLMKIKRRPSTERAIHDHFCLKMNANPAILKKVKDEMTKKLFDHLNGFDLTVEIDILDTSMIIGALNEEKFRKKQNMSTDGHEFKREIRQIKKDANKIHSMLLCKDNTLKLPQSAHLIKYSLIEYFKVRSVLSTESIKNISLLFGKNMPRSGVKSTDDLHDSYAKLGENIINKFKEGATLTSINNSIDNDPIYQNEIKKIEYYTPVSNNDT